MGRQGHKFISISQKGRVRVGEIPCDRHLGAVDFGLRRNDERAEANCSLHTELAEGFAAVNLEHGVVRQAHHERVKGSYQLYRIKGLARQGIYLRE